MAVGHRDGTVPRCPTLSTFSIISFSHIVSVHSYVPSHYRTHLAHHYHIHLSPHYHSHPLILPHLTPSPLLSHLQATSSPSPNGSSPRNSLSPPPPPTSTSNSRGRSRSSPSSTPNSSPRWVNSTTSLLMAPIRYPHTTNTPSRYTIHSPNTPSEYTIHTPLTPTNSTPPLNWPPDQQRVCSWPQYTIHGPLTPPLDTLSTPNSNPPTQQPLSIGPQINNESAHVLKMLAQRAPEKIASHTRSQQKLILRSAAQSTSVVVPSVHEGRVFGTRHSRHTFNAPTFSMLPPVTPPSQYYP